MTLSPAPGFRPWLDAAIADGTRTVDLTDPISLSGAAATYLTARRPDGRPLDAVARFHLRNGARLWRIDPGADPSDRGDQRSYGLMVNYRYDPEDRAANRRLLDSGGVAVGESVQALFDA